MKASFEAVYQIGQIAHLFGPFFTQPIFRYEPITGGLTVVNKLIVAG